MQSLVLFMFHTIELNEFCRLDVFIILDDIFFVYFIKFIIKMHGAYSSLGIGNIAFTLFLLIYDDYILSFWVFFAVVMNYVNKRHELILQSLPLVFIFDFLINIFSIA